MAVPASTVLFEGSSTNWQSANASALSNLAASVRLIAKCKVVYSSDVESLLAGQAADLTVVTDGKRVAFVCDTRVCKIWVHPSDFDRISYAISTAAWQRSGADYVPVRCQMFCTPDTVICC